MRHPKTLRCALIVLLIISALPSLAAAAPGGITIQILVESGRMALSPASAAALDQCLTDDGVAHLIYTEEGLHCAEPTGGSTLECAQDDGICMVDDISDRTIGACDEETGTQVVELDLAGLRSTGPLDLIWEVDANTRCTSPTGLCGNFNDPDDDLTRLAEAVGTCADIDGDGIADLFSSGDTVRCSSAADDGQPLVEVARARVAMPCGGLGIEIAIDAMRGAPQATTFLQNSWGENGLELRLD